MAHIILTGATGQAGAAILKYALSSPSISHISVLSRRPVKLAENNPKASIIVHKDFATYPDEVLTQLKGATACIWAQGISSRGMSEADYAEITVDYPLAAARSFATLGDKMNFVMLSGDGANMDESKASMMFGKIKGRAERKLLELQKEIPSLDVYGLRPAIINPQGDYLAERKVTLQDRLSTGLGAIAERVYKSFVVPTNSLAKVCVDLALGDGKPIPPPGVEGEGRILSNSAIRRLAGI